MKSLRNESGLTLIELMVSVVIMTGISLLIAQAVQSGVRSKKKIENMIERETLYADVIKIIEGDINRAFHYRDFQFELQKAAKEARDKKPKSTTQPNPNDPNPPAQQPVNRANLSPEDQPPTKLTQFEGKKESLHFTSLTNYRVRRDSQESQQAEVGYFTRNCRRNKEDRDGSTCLVRRLSPYIDDDVTKGGKETVLLHNVESLSFRYFGEDREDWEDQWSTKELARPHTRDRFPYAVEVTLKIINNKAGTDEKKPSIVRTLVAIIRFPNNEPKKQPKSNQPVNQSPVTSGSGTGTDSGN